MGSGGVPGEAEEISIVVMAAWQGRQNVGTSWGLHETSPSPTPAGSRLPGSHSSDLSMKSWQQTWAETRFSCGCFQSHLLFVHPSFLPAFLGSSSTPRLPSPCSFLIYALGVCQPRPGGHCWMLKDFHKICKHAPPASPTLLPQKVLA